MFFQKSMCAAFFLFFLTVPAFAQNGSISGIVWEDTNANSIRDAGEPGLPHYALGLWTVADYQGGGTPVIAITDGDGAFSFTGLAPEDYIVLFDHIALPTPHTQTYDYDGVQSAGQATVTLASGQHLTGFDFGYQLPASGLISGEIWDDENGNGVREGGSEPAIGGVVVELEQLIYGNYSYLASATTTAGGDYSFGDVYPGTYRVTVDTSTLPSPLYNFPTYDFDGLNTLNTAVVNLSSGQNQNAVDFGYHGPGDIQGMIWYDENGDGQRYVADQENTFFENVSVRLEQYDFSTGTYSFTASTWTDSWGGYRFEDLDSLRYRVVVDPTTLPANLALTPTYDPDGIATAHEYEVDVFHGITYGGNFGYGPTIPTNGLVGYWNFDEGSGATAYDSSGSGYDGTLLGSAGWARGVVDDALDVPGWGSAVDFASTPLLETPNRVTVMAWVKHNPVNERRTAVDMRDSGPDGYTLYINPAGFAFFRVNTSYLNGTTPIDDGQWHHIAGVYEGNQIKIYVDGQLDAPAITASGTPIDVSNTLRIGSNYGGLGGYFFGRIDEVRIYERGLSAEEIEQIYDLEAPQGSNSF